MHKWVATAALLFCLANWGWSLIGFWYVRLDGQTYDAPGAFVYSHSALVSTDGWIGLVLHGWWGTHGPLVEEFVVTADLPPALEAGRFSTSMGPGHLLFPHLPQWTQEAAVGQGFDVLGIVGVWQPADDGPGRYDRGLIVPWWLVTAVVGIWSARQWFRWARKRRRERSGRCPQCGYDLRATPERCPECGDAVPHARPPIAAESRAAPPRERVV